MDDLENDPISKVSKFADDTKLGGKALCADDGNKIQENLKKLSNWSEKWVISLNVEKSESMHIGEKNPNFKFQIRDQEVGNVKQEKYLGVISSCNLKTSDQCTAARKKGNKNTWYNFGTKWKNTEKKDQTQRHCEILRTWNKSNDWICFLSTRDTSGVPD